MIQDNKFQLKDAYGVDDLRRILELLRSEDGCPWDRVQTHQTIRANLLEEAYEAADAIDQSDDTALCEELGDVLLQVVFHARMAEEAGSFDLDQVADGVCKKLILRHPHVFGDVQADTPEQVLTNWEQIKQVEKHQETATATLESVPRAFPALMRAQKVQKRAGKAGFDWPDIQGALDKIPEESAELQEALASGDKEAVSEEMGDLLFAVVNVARFAGVDAEEVLQRSTDKFICRFAGLEALAAGRGLDMKKASLQELDELWDEVKARQAGESCSLQAMLVEE